MSKKINSIERYLKQEQQVKTGKIGNFLQDRKVRDIFFVHGTFAGDDSLGIINLLSQVLGPVYTGRLETLAKQGVDLVTDDVANYTEHYLEGFRELIGHQAGCHIIAWNGGNYHIARVKGALILIDSLAERIRSGEVAKGDRFWLIGHSHAGQLFALLTVFLSESGKANKLWHVVEELSRHEPRVELKKLKKSLKLIIKNEIHLDIATFGTPPRYPWGKSPNYSLVNVINDRSTDLSDVSIADLLYTRDGDYVCQWGGTGTDFIAPESYEKELNERLDEILKDKSQDLPEALQRFREKKRILPGKGKTLLVDYGDESESLLRPNCIRTLFGHGGYTREEFMLFNTHLLINAFYPDKAGR